MRLLFLLSLALFLLSCKKENETNVITHFPTTLIYDTLEIVSNEVYDKDGKLTDYNDEFDELEYSPLWLYDSMAIFDPSKAIKYKTSVSLAIPTVIIDTFNLVLAEDRFQLIPFHLPDAVMIIDSKAAENYILNRDTETIKNVLTDTYLKEVNSFYNERIAIRIYTENNPDGFITYDMIGQYNAKNIKIEELYKNLESNEFLSILRYRFKFNAKI